MRLFRLWPVIGTVAARGVVDFALEHRTLPSKHHATAMRQSIQETMYNIETWSPGGFYATNISVGTPGQLQTVIVDTGSSDTYLDSSSAPACLQNITARYSRRGGTFNSNLSSTYKVVKEQGLSVRYYDGTNARGDIASDVMQFGDLTVDNIEFGVAEQIKSTTGYALGLLGLGYSANEAGKRTYPNVPDALLSAGAINSRLYSIYLNASGQGTGSILFGGIDTSKFTGDLTTINIVPLPQVNDKSSNSSLVERFVLPVSGLSASTENTTTSFFQHADFVANKTGYLGLLDTGSTPWTLPLTLWKRLMDTIGLDTTTPIHPCTARNADINLTLTLDNRVNISIPFRELIIPLFNWSTNTQFELEGTAVCSLMLMPATDTSPLMILGTPVLRSAYVVFDMDNGQIAIGQARHEGVAAEDDGVRIVPAGPDGLERVLGDRVRAAKNTAVVAPAMWAGARKGTTEPAVGTATGTDAVPVDARPTSATWVA